MITRSKSASGIAVGPPLMWNDTCGCILSRWSPVIAPEPGIDEPPVWQVVISPAALRVRHHRHVVVGGLAPRRSRPWRAARPCCASSRKSASASPGSRITEPAITRMPPGPVVRKAALRRDRQRLDALDVARPPRHVHLGGRDRGRGAAVQVAFEVADGALARRVVAEGDVHVRIDQARNRRHAAGVDHHVGALDRAGRRGADRDDALALGEDRVAGGERIAPVAGDDLPEIDDRDFHQFARPSSSASW